ncbi:MAG: DUF4230 domain-containing protein [Verrucomicrobia bacterium]|nr:MAG: DUF4230 domain-containing protein [Verrucomicrobiota bacterium]
MQRTRLFLVAILLLLVLVIGAGLGFFVRHLLAGSGGPRVIGTAAVLQHVQTLSQLVTVKYVMEKVVVMEDVKWFGENRVLMVAHGVVKAGVDLSQLKPDDVKVGGQKVKVTLPRSQITDAYLDEKQTHIIERSTGLLREFDKDLEQTARQNAVDDIRRAARLEGIQKDADERARLQIESLLRQMGFTEVTVVSR